LIVCACVVHWRRSPIGLSTEVEPVNTGRTSGGHRWTSPRGAFSLGIESHIVARPNEVDPAIPFAEDYDHAAYDPDAARTFWQQLVQAQRVIGNFRAAFVGKVSPVHFFWGALDLACTRFSGRPAPAYCPMRPCAPPTTPTMRSLGFFRQPTRRPPSSAAGTARHSKTTRTACRRDPSGRSRSPGRSDGGRSGYRNGFSMVASVRNRSAFQGAAA
jgi:hypothetical protein